MGENANKTRTSGDQAREKILAAATDLFIEKGYSGTSMGEISKRAAVTKSLLYHHFDDKKNLWRTVKQSILDAALHSEDMQLPTDKGLRAFLEALLWQRFKLYKDSPNLARMISWQQLEEEGADLRGGIQYSTDTWLQVFSHMQTIGEIKSELDIQQVVLYVMSVLNPLTSLHFQGVLTSTVEQQHYLSMCLDFLIENLKS